MQDSHVASRELDDVASDEPPNYRLVIRARIISEPAPESPARTLVSKRAIASVLIAVVLLVAVWLGMRVFNDDASSEAAVTNTTSQQGAIGTPPTESSDSSRPREADSPPAPTRSTAEAASPMAMAAPAASTPRAEEEFGPLTSAVNEVLPDVPQSALRTIRGTVRVAVRVTIAKDGSVTDARSHQRGPSRYFERLSLGAAKQWTFKPSSTEDARTLLLRFFYTRDGATARVEALE